MIVEEQVKESYNGMIGRLEGWLDIIITNLPNFILALIVFVLTYWLATNLKNWLDKPLRKIVKQPSVRSLIANIASIVLIALGLFLALGILNLDTVLKSLLAGAGVAGLAIGLALQGTLSNTFSGILLAVKDIMSVGDYIETNGYEGKVQEINLRNTKIKEPDNNIVIIPNSMVLENPFKNYGLTSRIRVTIHCGVGYESDLEDVKRIATEAIAGRFQQDLGENVEFHYLEFGDSSINFRLRYWVKATENITTVEATSEGIMIIKKAFDENGINIPFPIRTLQMDSKIRLE